MSTVRHATRGRVVLLGLVGSGVGLLAAGRPWVRGTVEGLTTHTVTATGGQAYPGLSALAVVAATAALAATLAGRVVLRVLAVILALLGGVMATLAIRAITAPAELVAAANETGETLPVNAVALGEGVPLALVCAGLLGLAGFAMWRASPRWSSTADRYAAAGAAGPADLWESLTRGEDPTSSPEAVGDGPDTCKN